MKFLRFLVSRSPRVRWTLLIAMLVGMISGFASVGLLSLVATALHEPSNGASDNLALLFVILCVVVTITRIGSQYMLSRLGQGIARDLRLELGGQILGSPLRRLEELGPNRLLATLTDDINSISQALTLVPIMIASATITIGCLGYLGWLERRLFLMLLVVVVLGVVSYNVPMAFGMRKFRQAREEQDELYAHFRGLTDGVKELMLGRARRSLFTRLMAETADRVRRLYISTAVIVGSGAAWGHLLFFVVIGLLLFARPEFFDVDTETLTAYTIVLIYMMSPMQLLLDNMVMLARAEAAMEKVDRLGLSLDADARALAEKAEDGGGEIGVWQSLELVQVQYVYRPEGQAHDFVVGPIDLTLAPGEVLFVVGGNGSGKTTLAKLLVGLYSPAEGEIRLDGEPIREYQLDDYRELFSVVFGDFYLFEELISAGSDDVGEQAERYLRELEIDHKVKVEGGKFSTLELSLGQRKRLALLTAYLEDRPIYVFDEWAADQDPVFKEVFYHQILAELKRRGKAVVVISHDDRYFHIADRILKLEDGRVVLDDVMPFVQPASPASRGLEAG